MWQTERGREEEKPLEITICKGRNMGMSVHIAQLRLAWDRLSTGSIHLYPALPCWLEDSIHTACYNRQVYLRMLISPFLLTHRDILSQSLSGPKVFQLQANKKQCLCGHPSGGSLFTMMHRNCQSVCISLEGNAQICCPPYNIAARVFGLNRPHSQLFKCFRSTGPMQ